MGSRLCAPGPQQQRLAAYLEGLAQAAGHADRVVPLKNYCIGLLLPGERKSVEPMAARLAPDNVRRTHQCLHHLVADAPWSDEALLGQVRRQVLPVMERHGPVVAWVVDDTGLPKKGKHSVGVAQQYCGRLGKLANCQVAVSLSVATASASLPVAWRLYLSQEWAEDAQRRQEAGVPEAVRFHTKPQLAGEQIRQALAQGIPAGVVLADAAYGDDSQFRAELEGLGLEYVVGVKSTTTVWRPGEQPLPAKARRARGRPPRLLRRDADHHPVTVEQLAAALPASAWKDVRWREGRQRRLRSRFAAVRVRPAHRDYWQAAPHAEQGLLIEWPRGEPRPTNYWLSNLPEKTPRKALVRLAHHRWVIERDYEELKQEVGLGHFEGRGWRGFHHHATLCIAAYGFLVAERNRFSPSAVVGPLELPVPPRPVPFRPRGAPGAPRAA